MNRERHIDFISIALILSITVIAYWKVFDNYLFLDDTNAVFAGYLLSKDFNQIFSHNFGYIYMSPLWRVVVAASYVPNYLLSGYDPWSYYAVNLTLHASNGLLVYWLVKRLSGKVGMGLVSAVIFTVSLNKADAVMMVAHRTTLMGTFFILTSLAFYTLFVENPKIIWMLVSLGCFILALGSYETALVMPAVTISLAFMQRGFAWVKDRMLLICNALISSIVVWCVLYFKLGASTTGGSVLTEPDAVGRIFHLGKNVISVFPSFIIPPFVLQPENQNYYNYSSHLGWIEYLSMMLIAALLIYAIRSGDLLVLIGLALFVIFSLPSASPRWNFYPELPYHSLRFSIGKYSYLASAGFAIIAGSLLYRLYFAMAGAVRRILVIRLLAATLLLTYCVYNIYWLYEREKTWHMVTNEVRGQINDLKVISLDYSAYQQVYVLNNLLYNAHFTSLLRVISDNPVLKVDDLPVETINLQSLQGVELLARKGNLSVFSQGKVLFLLWWGV